MVSIFYHVQQQNPIDKEAPHKVQMVKKQKKERRHQTTTTTTTVTTQ